MMKDLDFGRILEGETGWRWTVGRAGPGRCVDVTRVGEGHPKAPQLEL